MEHGEAQQKIHCQIERRRESSVPDAAAKAIAGGEVDLIPAFAESMIKAIAFAGGHMYVARNEKGDIVGFALWIPSGHDLFNTYV
jgi:hypothetical protein